MLARHQSGIVYQGSDNQAHHVTFQRYSVEGREGHGVHAPVWEDNQPGVVVYIMAQALRATRPKVTIFSRRPKLGGRLSFNLADDLVTNGQQLDGSLVE